MKAAGRRRGSIDMGLLPAAGRWKGSQQREAKEEQGELGAQMPGFSSESGRGVEAVGLEQGVLGA